MHSGGVRGLGFFFFWLRCHAILLCILWHFLGHNFASFVCYVGRGKCRLDVIKIETQQFPTHSKPNQPSDSDAYTNPTRKLVSTPRDGLTKNLTISPFSSPLSSQVVYLQTLATLT